MTLRTKDKFRNDSPGQVGVTVIENGKERGIALRPGDIIWLSEEEQELTANAPRKDENNPFIGGNPNGGPALRLLIKAGEMGNRRPLGGTQKPEAENGAAPEPEQPETAQVVSEQEQRERQAKAKAAADRQAQSEETGAAKQPAGKAPQGQRAPQEEVGTPEAPAKAS